MDAYDKVCDEYSFIQRLYSRAKPVMLSEAMSYTHITGVYTYFTGEANINVHFPDYTIPYTAAHELAHQRGIAREDEANFVAFLVCAESDDPYIRYSGYLNLYEYVASALYADTDAYKRVYSTLLSPVVGEMRAYSAFFNKYRRTGKRGACAHGPLRTQSYAQRRGFFAELFVIHPAEIPGVSPPGADQFLPLPVFVYKERELLFFAQGP